MKSHAQNLALKSGRAPLALVLAAVLLSSEVLSEPSATVAEPAAQQEPLVEYVRETDDREATIEIYADRPASFVLPPTLFGTFTENIWDAVYGGVWAQVLHNPSFEPDHLSVQNMLDAERHGRLVTDPSFGSGYVRVEPLVEERERGRFVRSSALGLPLPWEPLRQSGVRYEPRDGDAANSYRSLLLMGMEGREIGIRQGVYLPVHRTLQYKGSLWSKVVTEGAAATSVNLTISVRRRGRADDVIARTTISTSDSAWKRYEFAFSVPQGKIGSLEKVDFCISLDAERRVMTDNVLLWPADHIEGFDPEVIEAARALRTPLLRFGGNFISGYHWQDGVGDPEKRRTVLNQAWGLPEYNHFGTDEFIRLCRLIGAEPQICINAGSGTAEEAAAWVEYCNGAPTTKYGQMRAANGHLEPFNVKYWEVGNELWGDFQIGWQTPRSNARRYTEFAQAIRRVDPRVRLIATGADIDFYSEWNNELIKGAGEALEFVSTHLVIGMQPGEQKRPQADDAFTHRADFAVPVGVGRKLDEMRQRFDQDARTRGRVKLAFTEWQFWSPRPEDPRFTNLGGAVNAAAFFNMLARRADFVPISNMSNLIHFAGIHRQRGRTFITPSYHVLRLYREAMNGSPVHMRVHAPGYDVREGNRRIPDIPNVPYLDALAVLSSDGDRVRVYLVNRNFAASLPVSIRFRGFAARGGSRLQQLSAERFDAANTPEDPSRVRVAESSLNSTGENLRLALPAHSLSVIEFRRR